MKNYTIFILITVALLAAGCENTGPNTKKGAVLGGAIGAVAGGIIGNQSGRPLEGAAIGGALGAAGGGLLGSAADQREKEAVAANPSHLPITRIAEMGDQGVPGSVIIDEIRATNSVYTLDSETIAYLKQHKVNDNVIDYMLSTGRK